MNIPELLAPAGSYDGLVAAVKSGADAVYLGLNKFSARKSAVNFSLEDLRRGIFYAHTHEVKVYVTLNTLVTDEEMDDVLRLAAEADKSGTDAFILQDMGLIRSLKNHVGAAFHASTQMTVINKEGARVLKDMGFSRIVPARELSLGEIRNICAEKLTEVEVFCHGALCMSYSGLCMMSRFNGMDGSSERSGNRGSCAQPCRMKYSLELRNGEKSEFFPKGYRMSPADLCSLPYLEELVATGVNSLKIEGRLKSPEYAALVTAKYRKALDAIKSGEKIGDISDDLYDLSTQFSRGGFSSGHQKGKMSLSAITFDSPGHSGAFCGKVTSQPVKINSPVPLYRVSVTLFGNLSKGDSIIFGKRFSNSENSVSGNVNLIEKSIHKNGPARVNSALPGEKVTLVISGNAENVKTGTPLYRTQDGTLTKELSELYKSEKEVKKVPVSCDFHAKAGEKASLTMSDRLGNIVKVYSDCEAQSSENIDLTEETVKAQLEKLGNTPFYLEKCTFDADRNIFLPLSAINDMRRRCANALIELKGACKKL